ncbi:ATP-dependent zinc metalloprotease FtsH [Acidaminobacter sp. JC074]|uniref:ATP-dependent zinc metalloprotease FtsH n=1 Tax=Acidaminobacter sp. JC074 TaxID=2530199 RepID=UPI001F103E21|nr:ATP-dependent zinc metalloprotease FtsH [Acidaminobacter sp. JC074]MCH4890707.1 ATP-dependent zinc metalloprotease FtsH [Acidaminobacter sp. JC074]
MNNRVKNIVIVIAITAFALIAFQNLRPVEPSPFTYDEVVRQIEAENVTTMQITEEGYASGILKDGRTFEVYVPKEHDEELAKLTHELIAKDENFELNGLPVSPLSGFVNIFLYLIVFAVIIVVWMLFMQNSQGGGNKVMSFGKSKAKLVKPEETKRITFEEVAGLTEEKEEMEEVVEYLKNPKKFIEIGARIPTGILMVGPPGTGKTYLSRAVAGEANVPFYNMSGSDFVEMFVGVGASRVRDLFETAKKNAPCIIFIDEIDAVGRKRGAGLGGGHDEREQTLNQLLIEMDGFSVNEGVIVIAATNRPDILDPALLRAGRFDREITIGRPDVNERADILKVHTKNKPLSEDVDLSVIAKGTTGFTPADLENLMNEAALLTGRKKERTIRMETIEEAKIKVLIGVEKKSRVVSDKEKNLTAYHEGGHALLAYLLPETDPVHQVTIIPRGRAGGFTLQLPEDDGMFRTKKTMYHDIIISLGGRVAEKLILDDVSTGASGDLKRVSQIARAMVEKYAFSENLASMAFDTNDEVFLGRDMTSRQHYSEHVAAEIDREVRKLVDDAYNKAESLLEENVDKLHDIAKALLEYETIDGKDFTTLLEEGYDALVERRAHLEEKLEEDKKLQAERAQKEKEAMEKMLKEKKPEEQVEKELEDILNS